MINIENFGKDHWSLFAYIESLCVDSKDAIAQINRSRMRCNPERHPLLDNNNTWLPTYSTRLKGFFDFPDCQNYKLACEAGFQVDGHDDWNCLEDLEEAGLIEITSMKNRMVMMTDKGLQVSNKMRNFKAKGGSYARFEAS